MTRRLQVLMDDHEFHAIQLMARREGATTAEWVRQRLREAHAVAVSLEIARKLDAIRAAYRLHEAPSPDIDQMLAETEASTERVP